METMHKKPGVRETHAGQEKKGRDTLGICENILSAFGVTLGQLICTSVQMRKQRTFSALVTSYCRVLHVTECVVEHCTKKENCYQDRGSNPGISR